MTLMVLRVGSNPITTKAKVLPTGHHVGSLPGFNSHPRHSARKEVIKDPQKECRGCLHDS
jgi:hypothetical protein